MLVVLIEFLFEGGLGFVELGNKRVIVTAEVGVAMKVVCGGGI